MNHSAARAQAWREQMSERYTVTLVPPDGVSRFWPRITAMLEPAVQRSRGKFSMADVYTNLLLGEEHLWIAYDPEGDIDGVAVTAFVQYPGRRHLLIHFLAGTGFRHWGKKGLDLLTEWGRDNGCQGVEAWGREGFSKMLSQEGYESVYVVYEKEI